PSHPDLHSFPTRRSSDLERGGVVRHEPRNEMPTAAIRDENLRQVGGQVVLEILERQLLQVDRAAEADVDVGRVEAGGVVGRDVRSEEHTSNSSHVAISYA